jgi:hypothetical protein
LQLLALPEAWRAVVVSRGTSPTGGEMVAVNVRCLDEVDIGALDPKPFDGRSL